MENRKNFFKYLISILAVIAIRLIPHIPNVEPVMASAMPWAKKYGSAFGMFFAFFSVIIFDIATNTFGAWSWLTAVTYAAIGFCAGIWLKNKENKPLNYVAYSFWATIVYDLITGLSVGVFMFHQSIVATIYGQIPFTAMHLVGNMTFAAIFSPLLYSFVIENKKLETGSILKNILPKAV
jgi:hypothetical protein